MESCSQHCTFVLSQEHQAMPLLFAAAALFICHVQNLHKKCTANLVLLILYISHTTVYISQKTLTMLTMFSLAFPSASKPKSAKRM